MKIIKFGGSSAATPERIKSILAIAQNYTHEEVAFVFSAFGGVTDQLIQISQQALEGNTQYKPRLEELEKRHLDAVRALTPLSTQSSILAQVKIQINELEDVLQGIFLVKERTARTLDYIMSFGERLSAYIISEAFRAQGVKAEFLDARRVIRTDNQFGYAKVDFEITNKLIRDHFKQHEDIQVITGFIATSESGETTTLGRSGSDYTAAIFAGALQASSLEIWTDVDGMMTADPRLVKKSFTVPRMSYEEAMELSHFGAKVIFPSTMQPAMAHHIPIVIKNTFNPQAEGTLISADSVNGRIVKGISSMNNISLLNVQGSGLLGVVGVSMRLFSTLAREKVNVILISQASSEHSICLAIESSDGKKAKSAVEKEFIHEIQDELIDEINLVSGLSIIAVVGDSMKQHPGASGRMFSALGKNGVNIVAIAQGSSERNISTVIQQSDVSKALNALHDAFFLSDKKTIHVFLVGTGLIGHTLIKQIEEQFQKLAAQNKLEVKLVGIANSKKMWFDENGLPLAGAIDRMKELGESMHLADYVSKMIELNLPSSVFVDCTSSEAVAGSYEKILSANISIVTPNKKANSAGWDNYRKLKDLASKRGVRFLYETNVGAGLPVINTLNDLLLSGDKVIRIEGVLSGTLNFIFSSFTSGKKFSEVVAEAKAKGYTEPDPRDDLSGMDVARKILILAREAGVPVELSDIKIENLVPADCRDGSVDQFFDRLKTHDTHFEKMRSEAEAKNEKLRYQAIFENGKTSVKLGSVKNDHPFFSLSGSDNIILLTTERYHERPMVIRGPGAGAAVTAAGVFADIIRIGNYAN
ncbi:MAG: bifunctional aspartate kinase/homoserine dehydrogenase I [Bacteroidetes bacterium]|nr:bifunctional aspartate kinase/homoserine dehydrogenase I [Bacteroidota bacterium]MBS1540517.1 bifunctional aspartate kinase/homoserine dehydrogenase I [Bacteroidota bacterium]